MKSPRFRTRGAAIRSVIAALALGLIALSSSGCGQRGPLYLPEPEPAADGGAGTGRGVDGKDPAGAAEPANDLSPTGVSAKGREGWIENPNPFGLMQETPAGSAFACGAGPAASGGAARERG